MSRRESLLQAVWRVRYWVVGFAVIAAIAAYLASEQQTEFYRAQARVQVIPGGSIGSQGLLTDQLLTISNVYTQLAQTRSVYDTVARQVGTSPATVEAHLAASSISDAAILRL